MVASVKTVTQVLEVIMKYVPPDKVPALIAELSTIKGNSSFVQTIQRLQAAQRN